MTITYMGRGNRERMATRGVKHAASTNEALGVCPTKDQVLVTIVRL